MPSISGRFNLRQIFLDVSIIHRDDKSQHDGSSASYLRSPKRYNALLDTGATVTMITTRVVHEMKLLPTGKMSLHGISGTQRHNKYLFYVGFAGAAVPLSAVQVPDPDPDKTWYTMHLCKNVIQGGELPNNGSFDVLLGMDIISTGRLIVEGARRTFSFSFD